MNRSEQSGCGRTRGCRYRQKQRKTQALHQFEDDRIGSDERPSGSYSARRDALLADIQRKDIDRIGMLIEQYPNDGATAIALRRFDAK
ncbi:hypothetical protein CIW50_06405 [Tardiphaga sp. P9-11]|nr:hypothetical protein CIW50_06405 [Tardiphaga sp. P9-11]